MRPWTRPLWRRRAARAAAALGFVWMLGVCAPWVHSAAPPVETQHRSFGPSGDALIDARAAALGHKLRCPVCQGMPIAESPATMAVDMMQQVRHMLAQGQSDADIIDYFTSRYGQWVLLEPPHDGFALWVWVLPPLCALCLLALAWRIVSRLRLRAPDDVQPPSTAAHASVPSPTPHDTDALLAAIRKEVDDT